MLVYYESMRPGRRKFYGKWPIHLAVAILLLTVEAMALAHSVDHLTHDNTLFCEFFEAVDNSSGLPSTDLANCLPLSSRDGYSERLPDHFQPAPEQRYLVRGPPAT